MLVKKVTHVQEPEKATRRKASFGATIKAVLWSFLGIRKKSGYEQDAAQLNPVHVLIAGVLGAIIFIVLLVIIVKIVVAK
ncbi:MAG: DUF2970 domain-containing protein [Pseudomonadota bacterium]